MLLTTHYLDEAQELADRVAIVKDGGSSPRARRTASGPGSSRYRVSYLSDGRRVEHQTDDPTELLHRLTRDALARGERLEGLEVTRPTLEEVYLELTREADPGVSPVALAWQQFRFERKLFWRNPSAAFFNFLLPLLLLVLTATAFSADEEELEILIPGHRRDGRARDDVHLARLQHHDPARGRRAQALARNADAGRLVPGRPARRRRRSTRSHRCCSWSRSATSSTGSTGRRIRCCWCCSPRSAWSASPRSGSPSRTRSPTRTRAPAYTNAVFLPTIFISGVFYSSDDLPEALKAIAEVLPLKHLIDGLSEAIVGGGGDAGTAALIVAGWTVARALSLAVRFFRWE